MSMSSSEHGYSDMLIVPTSTRYNHAMTRTAICSADVAWLDGSDIIASPRQILRQLAARRELGANAGANWFIVFDTYDVARPTAPARTYNIDYWLLDAQVEPLIRACRNSMAAPE